MIKNPNFYLDVFSYFLNSTIDDKTKSLYKQYLKNNKIVNNDYVDAGGYLHRPPIIINKYLNGNPIYDYWDYNVGLTGNITSFSKDANGEGTGALDDILEWEYRLDEFAPLTVHNYNYSPTGGITDESIGFDTGCIIDGVIINNCSLHNATTLSNNDYLKMTQCEIELTVYSGGTTINSNTMEGVVDINNSVNLEFSDGKLKTIGPGFVKIAFDKSLLTLSVRTDGFTGIKIGIRPDYTSVDNSQWLHIGGVMPYMEYTMGNPLSYNESISSVNYKTVNAKNGSEYSMTTRNKNSNRVSYQGNITYLSNLFGGGAGIAVNGIPVHNGKRRWALDFGETINYNSGDVESDGQLIPTNTDISAMPYSLSNVWKWDEVVNTVTHVTVERTEDVLNNLFARTGGGRLPFIFQGNSEIDDFSTAVLSDTSYAPETLSSGSSSLQINLEEAYL